MYVDDDQLGPTSQRAVDDTEYIQEIHQLKSFSRAIYTPPLVDLRQGRGKNATNEAASGTDSHSRQRETHLAITTPKQTTRTPPRRFLGVAVEASLMRASVSAWRSSSAGAPSIIAGQTGSDIDMDPNLHHVKVN